MKNKINGIDVSECRFYEPKAQKMTCHEEVITKPCESTPICYYKLLQKSYIEIQRLQEENKRLNQELDIKEKMLDKFMIGSGEILEKLQEENEELKNTPRLELDTSYIREKELECIKYKQALEEIRSYCDEQNLKADYTACYITNRIDEVLNDRD